jgi:hypothetical protein
VASDIFTGLGVDMGLGVDEFEKMKADHTVISEGLNMGRTRVLGLTDVLKEHQISIAIP